MPIEIKVDLAMVQAKAPLRALADVTIRFSEGEVTLKRCAVFHKTGEPAWANLPRLPIEKKGKKQFVSLIDLSRELKQRVLDAVLDDYAQTSESANTSSLGGSGHKSGAMSVGPDNPATAYGMSHQGPPTAGAGDRGPTEKLTTGKGRRRPPT